MAGSAHITTSDGMMYVSKFGAAPVSFKFDPSYSIGPSCKTSATFFFSTGFAAFSSIQIWFSNIFLIQELCHMHNGIFITYLYDQPYLVNTKVF